MGLSSAMDTNINSYSNIYISVDFWIMEGTMVLVFIIIISVVSLLMWAMCKVAGDSDKRGGQK